MDDLDAINAFMADPPKWSPPSIDDAMPFGKHKGLTYRAAAVRDPSYMRWAASTIHALRGQLCAEALAIHLGVAE